MLTDALLAFVPIGAPLSLIQAQSVATPSGVIDLLGQGLGTAPQGIIGTATVFGTDMGVGGLRPELNISVGVAFVLAGGATTLKIALQAAPDPGAAGNYTPANSAYVDIVSQDGILVANLTAGAVPFRSPWLPVMPPGLQPRFLRLLFTSSGVGTGYTAGSIASALVTTVRDDYSAKYAAKNFQVK